jgi:hypothetical protein
MFVFTSLDYKDRQADCCSFDKAMEEGREKLFRAATVSLILF